MMIVTKVSPLTNNVNSMELDIDESHIERWQAGEHIQNVMPHLSPDEREFLITGYTKEDWDVLFPPRKN